MSAACSSAGSDAFLSNFPAIELELIEGGGRSPSRRRTVPGGARPRDPHDLRRSFCSLAARRGVDPVQAARMTGHSLDVWTRHYAGDYGKPQRDEARARMLGAGFGAAYEVEGCR